jgi:hypothetical protein
MAWRWEWASYTARRNLSYINGRGDGKVSLAPD